MISDLLARLALSHISRRPQHPAQDERVIADGRARIWARTGMRPHLPADQRYEKAYLFGAICPKHGKNAAFMLPRADASMMQLHLEETSCALAAKAHAVLLMDRTGWHKTNKLTVPKNLTIALLPLPAPELSPVENIWQSTRRAWLSSRAFNTYDATLDAGCDSCDRLIASPRPSSPSACATGPKQVINYPRRYKLHR